MKFNIMISNKIFFLLILSGLLNACSPVLISSKDKVKSMSFEEMENPYNLTMRQRSDSDYTALNRKSGMYRIGEVSINLSKFRSFEKNIDLAKLSFSDSLDYIATVFVNGTNTSEEFKEDTVMMRGENPKDWKSIKNISEEPNQEFWKIRKTAQGFGNDCPPGICTHYFMAVTKSGFFINVKTVEEIGKILPVVKTQNDALFLLTLSTNFPNGKYAKTKEGYLILLNRKISDCPIDYADILYQVDRYGKVKELGRVITRKTALCH